MSDQEFNESTIFFPDDFDRIYNKYFKKLRELGNIESDLSYWYDSVFPGSDILSTPKINKYRSDYKKGLVEEKEILINCINDWDVQDYKYDEITICSSVTTASFIVMLFLKSQGISDIFFETPAYFASIEQADAINMKTHLLPTYLKNGFEISEEQFNAITNFKGVKAIWVTQPRFALGMNQSEKVINKFINTLGKNDYLIIDEATEQYFPAFLYNISFKHFKNIIKVRSFFKGSGLNGPRISYILHHERFRTKIENYLEVVQGAVDCFSLAFAKKHLSNSSFLEKLLIASNNYVTNLRINIQKYTRGTKLYPSILVNGYIGSISISLKKQNNYFKEREELLLFCSQNKVSVILGATMKFAKDISYEYIRINYFNSEYTILKGIESLIRFNNQNN